MPFLGENASNLLNLRRVVALIDPKTGFYGLAFAYEDGSEVLYGRRRVVPSAFSTRHCVEQSFPISGGEGELITRAQVISYQTSAGRGSHNPVKWIPQSIKVCPLPIVASSLPPWISGYTVL